MWDLGRSPATAKDQQRCRGKNQAAVKVRIVSAGETFKLELNAGKNDMAARTAYVELEKQLTLIALSSK
jgi:hypothetical protein